MSQIVHLFMMMLIRRDYGLLYRVLALMVGLLMTCSRVDEYNKTNNPKTRATDHRDKRWFRGWVNM